MPISSTPPTPNCHRFFLFFIFIIITFVHLCHYYYYWHSCLYWWWFWPWWCWWCWFDSLLLLLLFIEHQNCLKFIRHLPGPRFAVSLLHVCGFILTFDEKIDSLIPNDLVWPMNTRPTPNHTNSIFYFLFFDLKRWIKFNFRLFIPGI